jgi:hypothetical protein
MDVVAAQELTKVAGGWLTPDRAVKVTQKDIDHGVKRNQWACAIVRAIQRQYPDAIRVRVNAKLVGFTIDETRFTFPTPPSAVEAIIKPFDQGKIEDVKPTTVRLTAGKERDVEHADDRTLTAHRQYNREYRANRAKTERAEQMSPNYSEYERL